MKAMNQVHGPIRVLELRSVRGTGGGPEKTILHGAARRNAERFDVTLCYLRDEHDTAFGIDARARALGLDYVEVRERHPFDRRIWPALVSTIRARRIDIVHAHDYKTDALAWLRHGPYRDATGAAPPVGSYAGRNPGHTLQLNTTSQPAPTHGRPRAPGRSRQPMGRITTWPSSP